MSDICKCLISVFVIVIALSVNACGGGGSPSATTPPDQNTEITIRGRA